MSGPLDTAIANMAATVERLNRAAKQARGAGLDAKTQATVIRVATDAREVLETLVGVYMAAKADEAPPPR